MRVWALLLPSLSVARVIFAIEMTRNGATAPMKFYPWDQGLWTVSPGELTPAGLRQQYLIGTQMRYLYLTQQNLITANVSLSQVYILSTDADRTLMSAEAQALGLYPPGTGISLNDAQIQQAVPPISVSNLAQLQADLGSAALPAYASALPIHGVETNSSIILRPFDGGCQRVSEFRTRVLQSSAVAEILAAYPSTMSALEAATGLNATEVQSELYYIYDSVEANQFFQHQMPFTTQELSDITAIWEQTMKYMLTVNDDMNRLAGSPFLQELMWQFYGVMDNVCCYTRKLSVYISNGYSILMVLATLGRKDIQLPPYASVLLFELAETTPITIPTYSVNVTLNGQPIRIPTCPFPTCPFETFMKYVTFRSFPDAEAQCQMSTAADWADLTPGEEGELPNDRASSEAPWTLWFAVALVFTVAVVSLVLVWVKIKRSKRLLGSRMGSEAGPSDFRLAVH
jgi:hypothetical protein